MRNIIARWLLTLTPSQILVVEQSVKGLIAQGIHPVDALIFTYGVTQGIEMCELDDQIQAQEETKH